MLLSPMKGAGARRREEDSFSLTIEVCIVDVFTINTDSFKIREISTDLVQHQL